MNNAKYFKDYLPVPEEVLTRMKPYVDELLCRVILTSRASLHQGNKHMFVVLAKKKKPLFEDRQYVVWYYNDSARLAGLCEGNYDLDFKTAMQIFVNKLY